MPLLPVGVNVVFLACFWCTIAKQFPYGKGIFFRVDQQRQADVGGFLRGMVRTMSNDETSAGAAEARGW